MKCDKMISFVLSLMSLVAFTNSEEYQVSWQYDFLSVIAENSRIVPDGAVYTFTNEVNDAITWNFVNYHNLVEVNTLEEWLDCDASSGITRASGTKAVTTVFTKVNKRYFICTVGGPGNSHCDTGQQKLVVNTVVSPIDPETLVPTPRFIVDPETISPTPRFPIVNKCNSLTKKACKKNAKNSGECSYVDVYSCSPKGRKNKSNKKKCKKFNNGDKSLKKKDECEDKEKKGEKICKVKKVSSLGYCVIPEKEYYVIFLPSYDFNLFK